MPRVKNISSATGLPVPDHYIHTTHARFVDTKGRTVLLRGVNLSGSTKAPPGYPSQRLDDFWETAEAGGVGFVGHPLNLEDGSADVHLARLRGWGFNMLRYVVTWEALEHQGPGKYDYEYMDYTVRVLRRCKAFGFRVYIDPHQDLWSRFSGGSGAPFWTIAACGLEPRNFTKTEAALLHCEHPTPQDPDPANFPAMIWSTNYDRLASFTLFTMFFGGRDFAPKCVIDGVNIQDYLQSHYIEAIGKLADKIRDAGDLLDECVIGWDSLNEPSAGFIGHENLNDFLSDQAMKKGTRPTPAQCLRLGMGVAQTVETWGFNAFGPTLEGSVTVDPEGTLAWMDPATEPRGRSRRWGWRRGKEWKLGTCPWALHDVWDPESGYILIPDYFRSSPSDPSRRADFVEDYWRPHWRSYFDRIRSAHPEAIPFIQPPVFVRPPSLGEDDLRGRGCYSPHYYDGLTLITRHWNWFNADALGVLRGKYASPVLAVKIGERAIRKSFQQQLGEYLKDVQMTLGDYPTIMGEIGTPMDMDKKRSYSGRYAGDYSNQQKALDASLNACDGPNALNFTIWSYCADNNHEWGDNWNLEDLSLFSSDDLHGPEISAHYRMNGRPAAQSMDTINDRSNAQLLLTRASSIDFDRMDIPSRTSSYPQLPPANPSMTSFDTFEPNYRRPESRNRMMSVRRLPETEAEVTAATAAARSGADAETLYRFLTNGARAVGAFTRPWPMATVGTPTNLEFNISRAEFKLTVRVSADDMLAATTVPLSSASRRRSDTTSSEKEEVAPTEIFVPLVHFAADPFARRGPVSVYYQSQGLGRPSDASTFPLRSAPPQLPEQQFDTTTMTHDLRTAYPTLVPPSAGIETMGMPLSPAESTFETPPEDLAARGRGDALFPAWTTWAGLDVPLALEVEASEGSRWEVEGQVLRWWYPGPAFSQSSSSTSEPDVEPRAEKVNLDGTVERWIRIRRKGGAIKGIGTRDIYVENENSSLWDLCPKCCSW